MRIECRGRQSVENAGALRQKLLACLDAGEDAELDFTGMSEADLSFFQVLAAARRSFAARAKQLTLTPTLPRELAGRAELTGFAGLNAGGSSGGTAP